MKSEIEDADGHGAILGVTPVGAGVEVRVAGPAGELSLICTPARSRELAAALARAADEVESAQSAEPVTVTAQELRRGDVRDGDRAMTVEAVRVDGATAYVTWKSGAGRSWTQGYDADVEITLRRRA
ncbi:MULTISPECIES: hypothetical protein [unclassified Streptomyces]|uniref:hypothetical protein n=1 Tax=unclassified Streptomyces TaxID=2593676 RepID=UPI002DD7E8D6|nr:MULTISPECIES: hypothetical protein [unclassified Streptomyces]WSA75251.1 hypothetical protein OG930_06300 [Streptomyces sp. NBC_01799]WSF88629.1 hypothetical protein OIE70_39350 [Streptomyces sp. NBC_01744]WSA66647.1 hypothetical protein OIE65_06365 [Streptomyces sp. NBC_01800]WSC35201.1 hypothetical protein OHA08_06505 [Streptomyces sp. NBC_01763]WSC43566.1 hypothetical protein OIE61_06110 [Streptomyces sp. NBC_01762]